MKKIVTLIFLSVILNVNAEEEACAKSAKNGGKEALTISENLTDELFSGNSTEEIHREIAEELQEKYGNNVAYDGMGIGSVRITQVITVLGRRVINSVPFRYDGQTSIEKSYLDMVSSKVDGIDKDEPDSNPCDPNKNKDNGKPQPTRGGGERPNPHGTPGLDGNLQDWLTEMEYMNGVCVGSSGINCSTPQGRVIIERVG